MCFTGFAGLQGCGFDWMFWHGAHAREEKIGERGRERDIESETERAAERDGARGERGREGGRSCRLLKRIWSLFVSFRLEAVGFVLPATCLLHLRA